MLRSAMEIREVDVESRSATRYELFDGDTGMSLGIYDSYDRAQTEREHMLDSDWAAYKGGTDADPGSE
ncbi:hypothetical protein MHM84_02110 [Halomonas sp. McH1-25]|uniref:hypothetical protein n=1 Tax=unclassified Halomonas TaxID=2609666 RepID=UPI001EF4F59F|nr:MULTISPECIES: hypothetical protein [unclassified Halomonas]MCG7598576.1 hypothetical protein [Halomonas sp. McH1-25]MCP1342272.1 hypothetical protein [Halomonas sp. FL8]MCP1363123.1 hypothetical protein [Halomonas sp. BBD45]MCP1367989.1 hypothetical protein [Halomonas sp. BBD48]